MHLLSVILYVEVTRCIAFINTKQLLIVYDNAVFPTLLGYYNQDVAFCICMTFYHRFLNNATSRVM